MSATPARPSPAADEVAAVVLAAGAARRMGRPKVSLRLGGETFLERIARTCAAGGVGRGLVVTGAGPPPQRLPPGFERVHNPRWPEGILSSVQAAVRALGERRGIDALLLVPVDCPAFAAATVAALVAAWRACAAPVLVPTWQGRRGHPTLFARGTWPALLAAPAGEGARAVVRAHAGSLREVAVDDPFVVRDVDTPAEYRRLCRALGVAAEF